MMSESHRMMLRTHGTLVGRVLMGFLFFFSGIGMFLGGVENVAGMIAGKGLPAAALLAWVVVIVKVGAGGALILGYRVGCAAALLIGFTLVATFFFHMSLDDPGLSKNLAVIGGLLYVMAYGAGEGWKLG